MTFYVAQPGHVELINESIDNSRFTIVDCTTRPWRAFADLIEEPLPKTELIFLVMEEDSLVLLESVLAHIGTIEILRDPSVDIYPTWLMSVHPFTDLMGLVSDLDHEAERKVRQRKIRATNPDDLARDRDRVMEDTLTEVNDPNDVIIEEDYDSDTH